VHREEDETAQGVYEERVSSINASCVISQLVHVHVASEPANTLGGFKIIKTMRTI
jgi:hypothetical protein